jgi:hypothetical protein
MYFPELTKPQRDLIYKEVLKTGIPVSIRGLEDLMNTFLLFYPHSDLPMASLKKYLTLLPSYSPIKLCYEPTIGYLIEIKNCDDYDTYIYKDYISKEMFYYYKNK